MYRITRTYCILEVRDYLKEKKPDVMCIVETKLRKEIHVNFKEEGYNHRIPGGRTGRIKGEEC